MTDGGGPGYSLILSGPYPSQILSPDTISCVSPASDLPSPPQTPPHLIAPLDTAFKTIWESSSDKSSSSSDMSSTASSVKSSYSSRNVTPTPSRNSPTEMSRLIPDQATLWKNLSETSRLNSYQNAANTHIYEMSRSFSAPSTVSYNSRYTPDPSSALSFTKLRTTVSNSKVSVDSAHGPSPDLVTCQVHSTKTRAEPPTLRVKPTPLETVSLNLDPLKSTPLKVEPISRGESSQEELFSPDTPRHSISSMSDSRRHSISSLSSAGQCSACDTSKRPIFKFTPDYCGSLRQLEELEVGQESLNDSLLALTSHFAQVQFRLRQIIQTDPSDRDELLQELEKFAFTGCQDLPSYEDVHESICSTFERRLSEQKAKHEELIFQLKFQLKDLEHYAKQSSEIKTNEQIRRHKLVLEQIRNYLKIDISDLYRLPTDELQDKVEEAVQDMMAPIRSKEQMLFQLTTQVQDLERFIEFLHGTGNTPNALSHEIRRCTCNCPLHGEPQDHEKVSATKSKSLRADSAEFLSRTLLMFQVLVINSLRVIGCQWRNHEKPPTFMCHVRKLEESVDNLIRAYHSARPECIQDLLLEMVRKKVAVPLKMLLSHGLRSQRRETLALVSCATKSRQYSKGIHPWTLFLQFYTLQQGKSFTEQPQYQLSQSFGLRIQRQSINSKQSLLSCIHKVKDSHEPYKRSSDAKFKALIVHGINDGMLGQWFRVLAHSDTLNQQVYEPWSYMAKHGFSEAIKIVDRLSNIKFDLPTDTALKIFHVPEITETPIY
ncbi:hypothetical protein ACHWQZ_G004888 [Mnemiopsis leidyi]